jgi:Xaa-Pro dipeptidase
VSVHFPPEELADRRKAAAGELAGRGLDGLLMFRQESMYYLTGYDTFGYVFVLHCIVADSGRGIALSLGHTCLVTGAGNEVLTALPLEFIVV